MALADEHIVANADDVGHERDHVRRLAHGLAVCDLGFLFIEHLLLKTQQVARGGKREARARGVVTEDRNAEAGIEDLRVLVALAQVAQRIGHGEDRVDLVPRPVEVGLVHVIDVQSLKVACQFNSLAHR